MNEAGWGRVPEEHPLTDYREPPDRPAGRIVGLGAAVAALMVAGVFAVVSVTGSGGAGSPEGAVERLFAAVEQEDLLGVLESLEPAERRAIQPGIVDIAGELQRLGVLSDDLDLRSLSGLDIEVDDLALESESLADGIAAVAITGGTITTSARPHELPLGPVVRGFLDEADIEPETETEDLAGDARIVVVEGDGGWHVSLFYSIAEAARESAGMPLPQFGAGVQPTGSPSPQAVVEDLVAAAADLDVEGVIALVDPEEGRALHDYAPLFLDDADRAIAELRDEGHLEIRVDDLQVSVEERSADSALVVVDAYEVQASVPDFEQGQMVITATWDGECTYVEGIPEEEPQEVCLSDLAELPLDFNELSAGVVVVERDGRWFVSPTRTLLDVVVQLLGIFDRDDLDDPEQLFEDLMAMPFAFGAGAAGMGGTEEAYVFEETGPPVSDPGEPLGDGPEDYEAYSACFEPLHEAPVDPEDPAHQEAQRLVEACLRGLDGG